MIIKRYFDYILSILLLLILLPLFIVISILIKIFMYDGPVLYIQNRIGRNGKIFKIYKFRTMIVNNQNNTISIKNDNRITKLGKILRKTKLDEIPELFNILKGDMSFVGPRPDVPGYYDKLDGDDKKILKLKPGLSGPASLKYINEEEILTSVEDPKWYNDNVIFPDKVRINKLYYENWSFLLDLKIIFHTVIRKPYKEENYF